MSEDVLPADLIRESVYEVRYSDVLPKEVAIRYLSIPPDVLREILIDIPTSLVGNALYDAIKARVKEIFAKEEHNKDILEFFGKIAISAIDRKDGSLAVYSISDSIKLRPYQNIALFGIEGTPVLDFRDMDPDGACFKLGMASTLFLKNIKIVKYATQKLAEGDGRVIYDNRDVIIENYEPPKDEDEEEVLEKYLEIEFH